MHELALAEAVVAIAERHAGDRQVVRVELQVGRLRQVVPEALAFGFELAAQGGPAEGAELVMEEIPVRLRCTACGACGEVDGPPLACRACGGWDVEIECGEELQVVALEVEERVATARR